MARLLPANLFSFVQPRPTKNFEIFSFLGYLCGYQMKTVAKNSMNSMYFVNNIYPLGDAKEIQGLRVKSKSFFRCGANLPHPLPHRFGKVSYIFFRPDKRGLVSIQRPPSSHRASSIVNLRYDHRRFFYEIKRGRKVSIQSSSSYKSI